MLAPERPNPGASPRQKEERMKRRLLIIPIVALMMTMLALPALAHNFTGGGDCDSWNLVLDGTWNAHTIYVDGLSIGLAQTYEVADTSTAESREFTLLWDKPAPLVDVTVTNTLTRDLGNCIPVPTSTTTTTTEVEPTSTTTTTIIIEPTTTTTEPITTTTGTPPITTITVEGSTTTVESTTTTLIDGATATSATATSATTPTVTAEELPMTGDWTALLAAIALGLGIVGYGLVSRTRED